jgi:hypothetical protein
MEQSLQKLAMVYRFTTKSYVNFLFCSVFYNLMHAAWLYHNGISKEMHDFVDFFHVTHAILYLCMQKNTLV